MPKVLAFTDITGRRKNREVEVGSHVMNIPVCGNAKVGATAGWVITAGTNKLHATLPASQTGSTLVIPISGLNVGDTISAWALCGQVESAGGTVSMTADLRKQLNAAADNTDSSVSSDTSGNLVADTILSAANVGATGLTEVVTVDAAYYLLVTATTAASTDIDLTHVTLTVTRAS
jgi:hypothetical protein